MVQYVIETGAITTDIFQMDKNMVSMESMYSKTEISLLDNFSKTALKLEYIHQRMAQLIVGTLKMGSRMGKKGF